MDNSIKKAGGAALIVGAILGLVLNILHPRTADLQDIEALLRLAADSPSWQWLHLGLAAAVTLIVIGMVVFTRSMPQGAGADWARLAFHVLVLGAAMWLVWCGLMGYTQKAVADAWAASGDADRAALQQVGFAAVKASGAMAILGAALFFGVAFVLYGWAVVQSQAYPALFGWIAVVFGVAGVIVGSELFLYGPSVLWTNVLFPIVSLVLTLWFLLAGWMTWRQPAPRG